MVTGILEEFVGEEGNSKVVTKFDPCEGHEGICGTGVIAPLTLNLCIRRRGVVYCLTLEKQPLMPID
jgi:hypothetical protein